MNLLEQVALGAHALARAAARIGRGALWGPFLVLAALQALLVLVVAGFAHPALAWFAAPLLARLGGGEAVLHYPEHLARLPGITGTLELVLLPLVAPLAVGVATLLFAAAFGEVPLRPGAAWAAALRRAPALILTSLPAHLAAWAIGMALAKVTLAGPLGVVVHRVALVAALGGAVVVQAMFLFAPALVVIEGRGLFGTFAALPRTWARGSGAALMLCVALLVPPAPLQWLLLQAPRIAQRGQPELVVVLALVHIALATLAWFLLAGAATLVFLSVVTERGAGRRA